MRSIIVKILITLSIISIGYGVYKVNNNTGESETDGYIIIRLYNEDDIAIIDEKVSYNKGQTLFDIIDENYQVICADESYHPDPNCSYESMFGKAILGINGVHTDWYNNYIAIYINESYATYGVSNLPFQNGDVIEFRWTNLK